jgi:hypothetical protein
MIETVETIMPDYCNVRWKILALKMYGGIIGFFVQIMDFLLVKKLKAFGTYSWLDIISKISSFISISCFFAIHSIHTQ